MYDNDRYSLKDDSKNTDNESSFLAKKLLEGDFELVISIFQFTKRHGETYRNHELATTVSL